MRLSLPAALAVLVTAAGAAAQHGVEDYAPAIEPASDEPRQAMAAFRAAEGLDVNLVAAEPLLANPVAFCSGDDGRIYVVETHRLKAGVIDMRDHTDWVLEDLACRTVEDRVAAIRRHFPADLPAWRRERERIRCLIDDDGDGTADRATVFADTFGAYPDGIAAGVLADGDRVWFTSIPNLWELRDADRDGVADEQRIVSRGYGVHFSLIGHDMHGLRIGPDRRLYFSIGDRGFDVTTPDGRVLAQPDQGAVLRCELDGSSLEVVHTGLRNPQELAFDAQGDLFTGDNNSDGGDRARWVWIVEGGDSGWQIGYQWLGDRGAWNRERLWHTTDPDQPAWIVPPIAHIAAGPSGLTYNPGTGLPARWDGRFLLCDFRGAAANSGIWALRVAPEGASFALVEKEPLIWKVLATDVDFAPDGGVLLTDWVHGWGKTGRGRVFRVAAPDRATDVLIAEVRELLGREFGDLTDQRLVDLLAHRDQRVRQKAQFALVDRGAIDALTAVAQSGSVRFARLHAIWGIGILARHRAAPTGPLIPLCADADLEVRVQAIRVLGDLRTKAALGALIARLGDDSPRVRFHAAIALGRLGSPRAVEPLRRLLQANGDRDPYLRHAGVMGLSGTAAPRTIATLAGDVDESVRLGALLVERRRREPRIARFLADSPRLRIEAARAIHDLRIEGGLTALAAGTEREDQSDDAFARRALNARRLLGRGQDARALAEFATRSDVRDALRIEALQILGEWPRPKYQDRVTGAFVKLPERSPLVARAVLAAQLPSIAHGSTPVALAAIDAVRTLRGIASGPTLAALAGDPAYPSEVRSAALLAADALGCDDAALAGARGVHPDAPRSLRAAALAVLGRLSPDDAVPVLASMVEDADLATRQRALRTLGTLQSPAAGAVIRTWVERLVNGTCPPAIALDVLEAARAHGEPTVTAFDAAVTARSREDVLAPWRVALSGGDPGRGETLFREHPRAQCARCHSVDGRGGDAGPRLDGVGARQPREGLLLALIQPSAEIADGFATAAATPQSAMPPMGEVLSLGQIRDLIAFLASRR